MAVERLYLETSVWNFLFADDAPEKRLATERFFGLLPTRSWEIAISALVIKEVMATRDAGHRTRLVESIQQWKPRRLPVSEEALELAEKYILQGTLTKRQEIDARHAAVAVVAGYDVILSWNLRHLVKVKTRREINAANLLNGYKMIEIATPEEML